METILNLLIGLGAIIFALIISCGVLYLLGYIVTDFLDKKGILFLLEIDEDDSLGEKIILRCLIGLLFFCVLVLCILIISLSISLGESIIVPIN